MSEAATLSAEGVMRDHAPRVYSLARRMLDNDADAEDVTQDVMLQVVRKLPEFRGESALTTWLHRVTVNAALVHRRKRARREDRRAPESMMDEQTTSAPSGPARRWAAPPEQVLMDREAQVLLERAVAALPEAYRDVYVLADVEGVANAEIAEALGLGVAAVKSRLHRARMMVRDALAPHFEGAES